MSLLEVHKLLYFLQKPARSALRYRKAHYGPMQKTSRTF